MGITQSNHSAYRLVFSIEYDSVVKSSQLPSKKHMPITICLSSLVRKKKHCWRCGKFSMYWLLLIRTSYDLLFSFLWQDIDKINLRKGGEVLYLIVWGRSSQWGIIVAAAGGSRSHCVQSSQWKIMGTGAWGSGHIVSSQEAERHELLILISHFYSVLDPILWNGSS